MQRGYSLFVLLLLCVTAVFSPKSFAQSVGAGTIHGVVTDPTGGVVTGAVVEIHNPVSGYRQTATTGASGEFSFVNVPPNPYHLTINKDGFQTWHQDVSVRSSVPIELKPALQISSEKTTVVVESAADLIENTPIAHTDVDRNLIEKLPLESVSSSVSSLITFSTPGVAADSNGLFHALGEHAENSFSVDGQPITDQQSKVFSNQIPLDSIQSLEVVAGIPPAEYGEKTSLVINVVTRSGLGLKPTGSLNASYGSFGTGGGGLNIGFGNKRVGNFLSASGLQSGRFLDPPEFAVFHAKGNSQSLFDRLDFQLGKDDTLHFNNGYTRSWFQQPNSFDQAATGQDQRSLIQTLNVAPGWTHLFSAATLLTVNGFVRQDRVHFFPTANLLSDQPATLAQTRHLTNLGVRADLSYVKGAHNLKFGTQFQHTFLLENFRLGLTDPTFNSPCLDTNNQPVGNPALTNPAQCAAAGLQPNTSDNPNATTPFLPGLLAFDLSRNGSLLNFNGQTDIKQIAFYAQDAITLGSWSFNLGLRGDLYRGLSSKGQAQPRIGAAYNVKKTGTVMRLGYARVMVTPYNENLILSSATGIGGLGTTGLGAFGEQPPTPALRNQFNAGLEQAFGKHLVADVEYYNKYTRGDFDFDVLFSTPISFPIQWTKSKIDGVAARVSVPDIHGFTAFVVLGTTRDRFYPPERGGLIFNSPINTQVFRIDHDQAFQQTTHVQYQFKKGPWVGFSWRYDSGPVAGRVPFAVDSTTPVSLAGLTADQQVQAGLFCGSTFATLSSPLVSCTPSLYGSTRVQIPAPGTENDDKNPPRISPRHTFDLAAGIDNLFHGDRHKWNVRLSVINLTNKDALYNFLSTFSGTHFVTPRSYQGQISLSF